MWRGLVIALGIVVLALGVAACGDDGSGKARATLTWFIFNEPSGAPQQIAEACSKGSNGAYEIKFEYLPSQADQQREQLVRRLGAKDSSLDLLGLDVVWTGEFANAGWLKPVPPQTEQVVSEKVFDSVLQTARFEDKLYVVPIWSNTQFLWYRKDRSPQPPKTWDEMIDAGEKLGPNEGRIQVQANRYEGLVVLVNQLIESAGTSILAGPKQVKLDKPQTERALAVLGRLSKLARRRLEPHDVDRGHRAAGLRERQLDLHDQLLLRLSVGEVQRAGHLQGHGRGEVSAGRSRASRASRRSAASTSACRRSPSTPTRRSPPPSASSSPRTS